VRDGSSSGKPVAPGGVLLVPLWNRQPVHLATNLLPQVVNGASACLFAT
jgi:hypothetical protein